MHLDSNSKTSHGADSSIIKRKNNRKSISTKIVNNSKDKNPFASKQFLDHFKSERLPKHHDSNHNQAQLSKMMNNYTNAKHKFMNDNRGDLGEDEQKLKLKEHIMSRIDFLRHNDPMSDRSMSPHSQSIYSRNAHYMSEKSPDRGPTPQKNSSSMI